MMRSLWTAASGMISQQQNVDTISNNLANVNTYGYKKERMEFKTHLYETLQRANLDPANQTGRPVNLQVGHGVRPAAVARIFTMGNLQRTDQKLDFAIEGVGYFVTRLSDTLNAYTRDGAFKLSPTDEGKMLVTADGLPILGIDDQPIIIPNEVMIDDLTVDENGALSYVNAENQQTPLDITLNIVQFPNPQGLLAQGKNLYVQTNASGAPVLESEGTVTRPSKVIQGLLESSNVAIAEEMVSLIVAQRAYELSSKAITTSDDMLNLANNLKK